MGEKNKIADYKIIGRHSGNIYQFYCDLSGALCFRTGLYRKNDAQKGLINAWEKEGRKHFNMCHKCGKWVSDVMYNPDVHNCIRCSPIEDIPNYCPQCGEKTDDSEFFCHKCGARLMYGGENDEAD